MSQSDNERDKDKGYQWSPVYDKIRKPQSSPVPQTQQPSPESSVGQQGSDAERPDRAITSRVGRRNARLQKIRKNARSPEA
jgi:hypothetical protein